MSDHFGVLDIKGTLSIWEWPLKMMRNVFHFTLKAIFVLKIFKFLSWLFGQVKNSLIRKIRIISKFMTSQSGKQTIAIHILPNVTRSKGNQEMKFHRLWEYNMRNIFLEKSYTKYGGETIPRPFSKKSKLSISLDQLSKVLAIKFVFVLCQVEGYRYILKLSCRPLAFTS